MHLGEKFSWEKENKELEQKRFVLMSVPRGKYHYTANLLFFSLDSAALLLLN